MTGALPARVPRPWRARLFAGLGLAALGLAVALYAGARRRPEAGRAAAADVARSIAVLPFTNLSGDSANEYFSDGISEEILNAVGQLPGVLVAARSSAFAFKGKNIPVRDVASQLQVAHVLEGSVQRAASQVRITVRLIDARTGYQRWSDKYDRDAGDMFAVEDEISRAIAGALRVELADKPAPGAGAEETADPQAHDLYLLGLHHMSQRTSAQDLEIAADYFAKAVARDSGYARPLAGLGSAKVLLTEYADVPSPDLVPAGRAAVTRALALDSTLAPAHLAYAYLLKSYDWNWPAAEREYRTAIALDPNLATAHQWLNELLTDQGRLAEARVELGKALALDPASPVMRLDAGQYYRRAGQLDSASAALGRATALNPRFVQAYMEGAMVAVAAGHYAEARALLRQGAEVLGEPPAQFLTFLSGVERPATRPAAVRVVDQWAAGGRFPIVVIARFYALLGESDRALTLLERAVEQRAPFTTYIGRWTELHRLAGEPRFQAVLRRIGLPEPAAAESH